MVSHSGSHIKSSWSGSGFITTNTHTESEHMAYFCRVRLRLPVQLLILFWASRWFMPSVAMPSMDRTMSPTAMPPFAAFPPSVSCKGTKTTNSFNYLHNQQHHSQDMKHAGGWVKRWCGKYKCSVFIMGFMDPFHHRSFWIKLMKGPVLYRMMEGLL